MAGAAVLNLSLQAAGAAVEVAQALSGRLPATQRRGQMEVIPQFKALRKEILWVVEAVKGEAEQTIRAALVIVQNTVAVEEVLEAVLEGQKKAGLAAPVCMVQEAAVLEVA